MRPAALLALTALAGCALVPGAAAPNQTAVTFLTQVPPAAALDSVAAWVPTADGLALEPSPDGLAIRDVRRGQDNVARVTARRRADGLTEVTAQSRYTIRSSGFRDLSAAVYAGQVPRGTAPLALPVHDDPPCFSVENWRAAPNPGGALPDTTAFPETPPQLDGGLEGIQRRVDYPASARRAGVEGQVLSEFVVGPEGTVDCAQVIASPHAELTAAVLEVVRSATFTPGLLDGQPVRVRFSLPFNFRLR